MKIEETEGFYYIEIDVRLIFYVDLRFTVWNLAVFWVT